ncbi:MAG: hypothetical protein C0467_02930 [Planctomycetaceae bacterium]|nr:hypothetical protein [Planctomycetaceae bacterium]
MIRSLERAAALVAVLAFVSPLRSQPLLPPPDKLPEELPAPAKVAEQPEPGVKVLDRGPVHEAFAQPGAEVRGAGMTAPKAPPDPIPELPPDTKPEGQNVRWVPGYWSWDADRKDFIWVSGFWRNAPPGRAWSAGRWKELDGKWTYLPGSWTPTDQNSWRIDLPQPPASVENGPNTPTDNPDGLWIPGAWEFRNEKYVWRPGFWAQANGDRMWVPSQYLATPYGYMYVPGYWDYPLEDRGILNACVCFTEPLWQTSGWAYRPRYAIGCGYGDGWGTGGLFSSLYIGPGFNNFYYGNYGYGGFGGSWLGIGFGFGNPFWGLGGFGGYVPWYGNCRGYRNPVWNHYCYLNRTNPNYARHVGNCYAGKAMGVPNAGRAGGQAPRPAPVAMNRPGVAGAVNTGVRAATQTATPPATPRPAPPLVQPASQVARTISTANATRAATQPVTISGAGNRPANNQTGVGGAPLVSNRGGAIQAPPVSTTVARPPAVGNPPGGVTITPRNGTGQPNNPLANLAPRGNDRPAPAPVNIAPANPPAPIVRGGTTPSLPAAPVIRSAPVAPPAAPVVRSAPVAPPVVRAAPAAPMIRSAPAAPPVMRGPPAGVGGGRPAGGIGGGGAPRPGGGGGKK